MPCYHPLKGWRSRESSPNGRRTIVFNVNHGYSDLPVTLPCGQCVGCRLERSRQWAIRCTHEASLHDKNCFITLTYRDEDLPPGQSLELRDFQLFFKKLRKQHGAGIRFYHCGEYGEKFSRPHYHACLFNFDFSDKKPWKIINDNTLYLSENLNQLWGLGHTSVGAVTFQSAAYVARYIMKKMTGDIAAEHYEFIDKYGEIHQRKPEYTTMSRRPGLGSDWLKKFKSDIYPDDFVVINGKRMRPPKFYDQSYEVTDPQDYKSTKRNRKQGLHKHKENNTPERLIVREKIQQAKLNQLPRIVE